MGILMDAGTPFFEESQVHVFDDFVFLEMGPNKLFPSLSAKSYFCKIAVQKSSEIDIVVYFGDRAQ